MSNGRQPLFGWGRGIEAHPALKISEQPTECETLNALVKRKVEAHRCHTHSKRLCGCLVLLLPCSDKSRQTKKTHFRTNRKVDPVVCPSKFQCHQGTAEPGNPPQGALDESSTHISHKSNVLVLAFYKHKYKHSNNFKEHVLNS